MTVDRRAWIALGSLVGWGLHRFHHFRNHWNGEIRAWFESKDGLKGVPPATTKRAKLALLEIHQKGLERIAAEVEEWPCDSILIGEEGYPQRLLSLSSPPIVVHYRGDLGVLSAPQVAVVGSRRISSAASSAAREILEGAHRGSWVVLSGGALGADGIAHRSSLDAGRPTASVLPSGLSRRTPRKHGPLFEEILSKGGLLLSEYSPNAEVRKYHFRRRNELIAALAEGVFVLRAREESGTMLTVRAARELGRPLSAMPGSPKDPMVVGCHEIIRDGGTLIGSRQELVSWLKLLDLMEIKGNRTNEVIPAGSDQLSLSCLQPRGQQESPKRELPVCNLLQVAVAIQGADGLFSIEELVRISRQSVQEVQTTLLTHELTGWIDRIDGERFRINFH